MVNPNRARTSAGNIIDMGWFITNGGLSDEEIALGTPDLVEAKNLEHHVARCAYRYRLFAKRQAAFGQDVIQIKYLMVGMIAVMMITSPQIHDVVAWVGKIL